MKNLNHFHHCSLLGKECVCHQECIHSLHVNSARTRVHINPVNFTRHRNKHLCVYVLFMKIPSPTAVRVFKKIQELHLFFNVSGQMIIFQTGPVVLSVLCPVAFSPLHCPSLKGQSLGHPHPSLSPQCPGTVIHPLQRCFQLQEKADVC